jgi:tetratricopeptide (TPR) repeat protein
MPEPARTVHVDDLPALAGPPTWRPIRTELGIAAFGVNAYSAAEPGDLLIEEHDEVGGSAGRHEELYLVVRGHARFTVDGQDIDAPAGTLVFLPDPQSRRTAVAEAPDTVAMVVGGVVGEAFSPSPWEGAALAAGHAQRGDHERALALARESAEAHPDRGQVLYNVACAESLAGESEAAIEHLRRALELEPRAAGWSREDPDLDPIRDHPDFPG